MGRDFPTLFSPSNSAWLRTMWEDGRPVSHVGVWRGQIVSSAGPLRVAHLGAVCTAREYRNQGLATLILDDTLERLRAEETSLVFISGGRGLYLRLGARPAGRILRYSFVPQAGGSEVQMEVVDHLQDRDLDAMRWLHGGEPVRYVRSPFEWRALLPAKGYAPARQDRAVVLVRRYGQVVAYLLLGKPQALPDGVRVVVDEFAGDRRAMVQGLSALVSMRLARCVELTVQPSDTSLTELLGERGGEATVVRHIGTTLVLDRDLLFRAVARSRPDLAEWNASLPAGTDPEQLGQLVLGVLGNAEAAPPRPLPIEVPRQDGMQYI